MLGPEPHVIRPLQRDASRRHRLERFGGRDARDQRKPRHFVERHRRPENYRSVEIHSGWRMPLPAHPAAPRILQFRNYDGSLRGALIRELGGNPLGRIDLIVVMDPPSDTPRLPGFVLAIRICRHSFSLLISVSFLDPSP